MTLVFLSFGAFDARQRPQLASDPTARANLMKDVLDPMLDVSLSFPKTVEAWEPVNEPNWATHYGLQRLLSSLGAWQCIPGVTVAEMQSFLDETTEHILAKTPTLRVTHGFSYGPACMLRLPPTSPPLMLHWQNVSDENLFSVAKAGGNYQRQFHYYPTACELPVLGRVDFRSELPSYKDAKQAFVGEFSTARPDYQRYWLGNPAIGEQPGDPQYLAWARLGGRDEPGEREATYYRLVLCNQLGYQKAYLWPNCPHRAGDPNSGLSLAALAGVSEFVNTLDLPTV